MIIFHHQKTIFIAIPKTGSSAIHAAYNAPSPEPVYHHQTLSQALISHPTCEDYFKFAFVRNPWDRLVSVYFDFKDNRINQYSGEIVWSQNIMSKYPTFQDFCIDLPKSRWYRDVHVQPQYLFVSYYDQIDIEFVGRFEQLNDDLQKVIEMRGLPSVTLSKCRVTNHKHYREYYDNYLTDLVRELYKEDIKLFDYAF